VDGSALANQALAAPALTHLGELQAVALELTRKKVDDLDLLQQWLKVLVAPSASLGGARPKANLQDDHTFVTQRFDCDEQGRRRFFTSAMAVLGRTDSEQASYLDLA